MEKRTLITALLYIFFVLFLNNFLDINCESKRGKPSVPKANHY